MIMKNKMKQLVGLALSATMLVGMVGCGSEEVISSSESKQTVETQESVQTSAKETEAATDELTYPLDTDDVLTLWNDDRFKVNSAYKDASESPFHTGLAERTGVEIEWQFLQAGANGEQAFNLLLTEDVLPDIIHKWFSLSTLEELLNDGVIYDLTEYLPKYAPDYWETLNKPEYADVKKAVTTSDGKQVMIPTFAESSFNTTYQGPVVRKDWLDECGLNEPVTLEDWEEMLTMFKEKYGATLGLASNVFAGGGLFQSGAGAYTNLAARWYIDDNNTVQFAAVGPEWKEYIEVLNRWYENGLINKDSLTMDNTALRTKALNNEIGASYVALSQLTNFIIDAENSNLDAEWIGVEYPRTAEGEPTCYIQTVSTKWANTGSVITTSCPEDRLITALQFLNYGYTEEGSMYWAYGEEGVSYTLNDKGEVEWTDLVLNDKQGINDAVRKYTGSANSPISIQRSRFEQLKNSQECTDAVYKWIDNTNAHAHYVPSLSLTDQENVTYTDKWAAINSYVKEMALKFATGEVSLDEYDNYVAQLNKMGLQECRDIQQAAYERYLAK